MALDDDFVPPEESDDGQTAIFHQIMQNSHFLCANISLACAVLYLQLT